MESLGERDYKNKSETFEITRRCEVSLVGMFIVDDSAPARAALKTAVEQHLEWDVVGEAWNGRHAIATFHQHMPHLTLMDFIMPEMNGLEAARHLTNRHPDVLILMVTTDPSKQLKKTQNGWG